MKLQNYTIQKCHRTSLWEIKHGKLQPTYTYIHAKFAAYKLWPCCSNRISIQWKVCCLNADVSLLWLKINWCHLSSRHKGASVLCCCSYGPTDRAIRPAVQDMFSYRGTFTAKDCIVSVRQSAIAYPIISSDRINCRHRSDLLFPMTTTNLQHVPLLPTHVPVPVELLMRFRCIAAIFR